MQARAMVGPSDTPVCLIDDRVATWEKMLPVATQNYGHITMLQMRGGMIRGLEHHLRRLDEASRELFGTALPPASVTSGLRILAGLRPDATVRVNVFQGVDGVSVMVTATSPIEPEWRPARFSLVSYERDMPHLKHVGSFGLSLRQRQAVSGGYDGAVFVDRHGMITEATIWNVGFFDGDTVVWPSSPSLRGVSQIMIDEGLAAEGINARYEPVRPEALGRYRSAFLSNSTTYGQQLQSIGDAMFDTPIDAMETIRRAYERTPWIAP